MTAPMPGEGELVEIDGAPALRFQRRVGADRADVWSALTDPDRMARWWFAAEIEPRAGGAVRFDRGDGSGSDGEVLAWRAGDLLELRWDSEYGGTWHIRVELADAPDGGTDVVFTHLLPAPEASYAAGWHWYLDRLGQLVGGDEPAQVMQDEHFDELMSHYERAFG